MTYDEIEYDSTELYFCLLPYKYGFSNIMQVKFINHINIQEMNHSILNLCITRN